MISSAVDALTSLVIGMGWYGEPFQHTGGGFAPSAPHVLSRSLICSAGISSAFASRLITFSPPSASRSRVTRLIVTTIDVRLETSARPAWSRMSPRTAGFTTSRAELLFAATR